MIAGRGASAAVVFLQATARSPHVVRAPELIQLGILDSASCFSCTIRTRTSNDILNWLDGCYQSCSLYGPGHNVPVRLHTDVPGLQATTMRWVVLLFGV